MSCYIPVVGLEIHIQLALKHKMFAPENFHFGAIPNTLTSAISLAHPGTLPTVNKKAVDYAIFLGLACGSKITHENYFARKNYFYPDLPKGYQITQDKTPICVGGHINYSLNGEDKVLNLIRIHMEEDAGKMVYDNVSSDVRIDFNRAGVALLEIVTEPEIRSSDEAYAFLHELRRIVRYLGICDGNMENGSLRCDTNISVMSKDSEEYGQRVEVKNINSMSNVKMAIECEIARQIQLLQSGKIVEPETRAFDAVTGDTKHMRKKETATDYRYFVEPDIPCLFVSDEWVNNIKSHLPLLPRVYKKKLIEEYHLSEYVASVLIEDKNILVFYENLCSKVNDYITVANWVIGPIKGKLNEIKLTVDELPVSTQQIADLIGAVLNNTISYSIASQDVLGYLVEHPECSVQEVIKTLDVIQDCDRDYIEKLTFGVLDEYKNKVIEYRNGKKGLLGLFIGEVIKRSRGKASPKVVNEVVLKCINTD